MSTEECKALAQSYLEKLINAHNLAAVDELFDPNIDFHDPGVPGGTAHGLKAVSLFFATFFAAFPDVHFTIEELLAEGNKVSARFTWRGTHRDKFLGIVPTHKVVTVPGTDIFHIANGKIVEVHVCADSLLFVKQMIELPQLG